MCPDLFPLPHASPSPWVTLNYQLSCGRIAYTQRPCYLTLGFPFGNLNSPVRLLYRFLSEVCFSSFSPYILLNYFQPIPKLPHLCILSPLPKTSFSFIDIFIILHFPSRLVPAFSICVATRMRFHCLMSFSVSLCSSMHVLPRLIPTSTV